MVKSSTSTAPWAMARRAARSTVLNLGSRGSRAAALAVRDIDWLLFLSAGPCRGRMRPETPPAPCASRTRRHATPRIAKLHGGQEQSISPRIRITANRSAPRTENMASAPMLSEDRKLSVEQFFEEALAALVRFVLAVVRIMAAIGIAMMRLRRRRWGRRCSGRFGAAPLDDLVELAAIEPDAAAGRAIIDLDILALAHHQRRSVHRAAHRSAVIGHA